jgi:polyhydroxybutyrate depolymerase
MTILGTADYISNYDGITYEGKLYYASADDTHELWLDANGIQDEPLETAVPNISSKDGSTADLITWESPDECVAVEHYRINGGGHDWPGTFGNMDIVAHEVIWDFVKQYGLSGHLDCTTNAILPGGETQSDDLLLYPMPASNHLNVTVPSDGPWRCTLINAQGQAIRSMQSSFSQLTIDCNDLNTGMYFIQATLPHGQSYNSQVLIER